MSTSPPDEVPSKSRQKRIDALRNGAEQNSTEARKEMDALILGNHASGGKQSFAPSSASGRDAGSEVRLNFIGQSDLEATRAALARVSDARLDELAKFYTLPWSQNNQWMKDVCAALNELRQLRALAAQQQFGEMEG